MLLCAVQPVPPSRSAHWQTDHHRQWTATITTITERERKQQWYRSVFTPPSSKTSSPPPTDATTQQPTTQVHDPSTGGQRHDAVGLMGFDGNNGGGCGRCSAPCSRAVDRMLQTAANSATPYCCLRAEPSPLQKGRKVFATCHRTASNGMMRKPVMSLENHDQMPSHTAGVDRTWRLLCWPGPRAFILTLPVAMCWLSPPLVLPCP
jgi:hypothetical protein